MFIQKGRAPIKDLNIIKELQCRDIHIIKDKKINLAYDIENSRLIRLNEIEISILETIKKNPIDLKGLRGRFQYNKSVEVEKSINDLINLELISFRPFKKISKKEIQEFEKKFLLDLNEKNLFHIALNVTHKCNLNCHYCYGDNGSYGGPEINMDKKTAEQAVNFLMKESGESKNCRITFFGGEPLLNFNLVKYIVHYAKKISYHYGKNIYFSLTTNGTLLDDQKIDFLIKENIDLTISIDGPKEIHNLNRPFKGNNKTGSYEIIIPNVLKYIEKAKKYKCYYCIRGTVTHLGIINICDLMDYFKIYKTNQIKLDFAEYKNNCSSNSFIISDDDLNIFRQKIKEAVVKYRKSRLTGEKNKCGSLLTGPLKAIEKKIKRKNFCISPGSTYASISVEGDVFPCHRFVGHKETKIGNIWNGINRKRWFDKYKKVNIFNSEKCSKCWVRYFCGGLCPATNYYIGKELNLSQRKDLVHCKILKILMEESMLLYSKLYDARHN